VLRQPHHKPPDPASLHARRHLACTPLMLQFEGKQSTNMNRIGGALCPRTLSASMYLSKA
jgi:hypothetical protein